MKKITALILAIILCFTLAIPALGSEMSVNGQAYSINGIAVYKYPLKASQYFSVETIIYFVSDAAFAQVPVNDDVGVYLTHGMSVEFDAENDTWFKIGVNMQNPTNEDIIVYVEVENVEVRIVDEINSVIEWFDYLETPDEMKWDGSLEISLTEFPDVTFRWTYGEMLAVKGSKSTSLYTGMPIWNAYFCDLTGDGLPELCSSISWGSGMIDNRVIIYDYANGVSYELSDRGYFDFTLRQDHQDGRLYVDKTKYHTDELVETGRLVFKNHCIQIEGFSNEAHQVFQAEILEIHDGNYLVKPVEGSWELSSADRIEVPIRNVHPSPEPEIGDVIEIEYAGEILETYPAQIADVYGIKVIEKNKGFTHLANDD